MVCFVSNNFHFCCKNLNFLWLSLPEIILPANVRATHLIFFFFAYMDQSAILRLDWGKTRSVKIGRGVRQGCSVSLILFNLYSEYLTKKALVGVGYSKIRVETIHNVKYAEDLLLAKKKLYYGSWLIDWLKLEDDMEWKWMWKDKGNENLKATISDTDYDIPKTTAESGIFQLFW